MSPYFVTGTGTNVGKTFTTCALLHAARMQGRNMRGLKPIISGWDEQDTHSDVRQIMEAASSLIPNPQPLIPDSISPWRFTAPLSPHQAAAMEGREIDVDEATDWLNDQIKNMCKNELLLIEGAGGGMTPLTDNSTMLDLMEAVNLPVILVVGSYLGTITHTLTALAALRARGLKVAALVMNASDGNAATLAEAEAGLAPFIRDIPLRITQPRVSSWREARAIHAMEL